MRVVQIKTKEKTTRDPCCKSHQRIFRFMIPSFLLLLLPLGFKVGHIIIQHTRPECWIIMSFYPVPLSDFLFPSFSSYYSYDYGLYQKFKTGSTWEWTIQDDHRSTLSVCLSGPFAPNTLVDRREKMLIVGSTIATPPPTHPTDQSHGPKRPVVRPSSTTNDDADW